MYTAIMHPERKTKRWLATLWVVSAPIAGACGYIGYEIVDREVETTAGSASSPTAACDSSDASCSSEPCAGADCPSEGSCDDGVRNGDETDADCGGSLCRPCGLAHGCIDAADCHSGRCNAGLCEEAALVAFDLTRHSNGLVLDSGYGGLGYVLTANVPGLVIFADDGVTVANEGFLRSTTNMDDLRAALVASGAFTVETWLTPAQRAVDDAEARMVTLTMPSPDIAFGLLHGTSGTLCDGENYCIHGRVRRASDPQGLSEILDRRGFERIALTHILLIRHADGRESIFVNGDHRVTEEKGGSLDTWPSDLELRLGQAGQGSRAWAGTFRYVALHDRAVSAAEATQRFEAGPP